MPTRLTGCGACARAYSLWYSATCTGVALRPPYDLGPVHADPAVGGEGGLPLPPPGHFVGQVDECGWAAQVLAQPGPERGRELLVLFFQREIHAGSLHDPDIGVTIPGPGYGALP